MKGLRAFTLVELLSVIALLSLLAALILPAAGSVRERGRRAACLNNVRQLAVLAMLGVNESGALPDQFANPAGRQGQWGNEIGGPGSGSDWRPTGLFPGDTQGEALRMVQCPSDANFFPEYGVAVSSYKHWFNQPQTAVRRRFSDEPASVIVSEHASNHSRTHWLLDEEAVHFARLDGTARSVVPGDADYDDVHRWGTLANGTSIGSGPLP